MYRSRRAETAPASSLPNASTTALTRRIYSEVRKKIREEKRLSADAPDSESSVPAKPSIMAAARFVRQAAKESLAARFSSNLLLSARAHHQEGRMLSLEPESLLAEKASTVEMLAEQGRYAAAERRRSEAGLMESRRKQAEEMGLKLHPNPAGEGDRDFASSMAYIDRLVGELDQLKKSLDPSQFDAAVQEVHSILDNLCTLRRDFESIDTHAVVDLDKELAILHGRLPMLGVKINQSRGLAKLKLVKKVENMRLMARLLKPATKVAVSQTACDASSSTSPAAGSPLPSLQEQLLTVQSEKDQRAMMRQGRADSGRLTEQQQQEQPEKQQQQPQQPQHKQQQQQQQPQQHNQQQQLALGQSTNTTTPTPPTTASTLRTSWYPTSQKGISRRHFEDSDSGTCQATGTLWSNARRREILDDRALHYQHQYQWLGRVSSPRQLASLTSRTTVEGILSLRQKEGVRETCVPPAMSKMWEKYSALVGPTQCRCCCCSECLSRSGRDPPGSRILP